MSDMLKQAQEMLNKAYAPYSNFKVGAVIKTKSGQHYAGCNVENVSYGLTSCAEASAISMMIAAGEQAISEVLIIASSDKACPPCGACRQRLAEFSDTDTKVHLATRAGIQQSFTLAELLPLQFQATQLPK